MNLSDFGTASRNCGISSSSGTDGNGSGSNVSGGSEGVVGLVVWVMCMLQTSCALIPNNNNIVQYELFDFLYEDGVMIFTAV